MKKKEKIIGWAFVFSILTVFLILGGFLALHDIKQDYVNDTVFTNIHEANPGSIADWAACKLEWGFMKISLLLQTIFMIVIVVALAKATRLLKV